MADEAKSHGGHYPAVSPYLCCKDAARALEFYKEAFAAVETMRLAEPSGRIGHAEIKIGDGLIMLADEFPQMGVVSPESLGGSPVTIHVYVPDVDTTVKNAVAAGAKILRPVEDQFYGDRCASLIDPIGHRWMVATHKVDVSIAEMQRRYDEMLKQH